MTGRNPSLDVLRGIAVLLVIVFHAGGLECGWIGVDLFFVLSGFLISGLLFTELERNGKISVGRFLIRRGFKIYPSFYVFVLVTAFLVSSNRPHLLPEVLFVQNYALLHPLISDTLSVWVHTWSLAVEEHFYIVLPFVLILLTRIKRLNLIPAIAVALLVFCCAGRMLSPHPSTIPSVFVYPTHLRIDALFAGVAICYLSRYEAERFHAVSQSRWLLPIGLAFIAPAALLPHWFRSPVTPSLILTANIISFSAMLLFVVNRKLPYTRHLAELGKYSYSIYLWHMPLTLILDKLHPAWLGAILSVIMSCAIGVTTALLIEFPALWVRDTLFSFRAIRSIDPPANLLPQEGA